MKVLWFSNAPWSGSGYGQQTDLFTRAMADDGHDVVIAAFYGLQAKQLTDKHGRTILPGGYTQYGEDVIIPHWRVHKPDVFVGLIDVWVYEPDTLAKYPNAWWAPVDCDPIPPKVADRLRYVKHPWAMSRFGERKMREAGIMPRYVPHGIDTQIFKPVDRNRARHTLNVPEDAFLFCTVAANKGHPSRKNLPQLLKAFAVLQSQHDDVYLYVHTNTLNVHDGLDLQKLVQFYEIDDDRIIFPDVYELAMGLHEPKHLNLIYNAADAFILPSAGEGFGIPVIEAQAAGCPVIVSDFTAQSELCGSGIAIAVDWDDLVIGLHYSEQAQLMRPSKILAAMTTAYESWKDKPEMRDSAQSFAQDYDYRTVYTKYMKPALEAAAAWNNAHKGTSAAKYDQLGPDYHWSTDWQNPQGHYVQWVDFQLSFLPEDGNGATVLDFGCGDGYPASVLTKRGFKVYGVEPVRAARHVAMEKVPDAQFFASYDDLPDDITFDYVVALDVIEHIEESADLAKLAYAINHAKHFSLLSTPPPGIDKHAVAGYTVRGIKDLFPNLRMDVLECSRVDQLVKLTPKPESVDVPEVMKIAVLSDCRVPTKSDGAHGLGNSAYEIATGLAKRGHQVTLFAGPGSEFDAGDLMIYGDEQTRAADIARKPPQFDVYIDTSHKHVLSTLQPDWPVLNRMGDGECGYSPPNKIVMTDFLRNRYGGGRQIATGIRTDVIPERNGTTPGDHVLFFGRVHPLKGVDDAMEAARLAGVDLKFVGPLQADYDVETEELTGDAKWQAIHQAKAVLLPGGEDFAPRAPLEVAAAGVPVITLAYDGTAEHVRDGVSGFVCDDVIGMAEAIGKVDQIDGTTARQFVETWHGFDKMIDGYVTACQDVIKGERW